jgi:catechol 2,3-dioxygenase-like lactoylglutathione lyase family enzyme
MLEGVAVVWMPVQDIERAKGFYRDTLGLPLTNEDGDWAEVGMPTASPSASTDANP